MQGNFPWTEVNDVNIECNEYNKTEENNISIVNKFFKNAREVSAVSGVAALRNQYEHKSIEFVQGIEKFIDSMSGKEYSAVFIADVVSANHIEDICMSYENIYSQLSPFTKSQQTLGESHSESDTESIIKGVTDTTNDQDVQDELNLPLYFADAYCSWQRGCNENSNGLLREFYPKKTNLALVIQQELTVNLFPINSRPHKCLGWKSSIQVFLHEVAHLTLQSILHYCCEY